MIRCLFCCSGRLVSPKWKNFKGLKLQWRDKIRLNNAIWRAWYMQYLEKRKNPVCHFVTPLDGSVDVDEHRRPEAIATEGKYWKRRIEIVIREYHKWRTYFKKRLQKHKDEDLSSLVRDDDVVLWQKRRYGRETPVPMEEGSLLDADMLMSEFTDTLFSTLSSHQLVSWPNSRDIGHLGNADMIQPGLIPLQPNFDFMDTFEPFQELFTPSRSSNYFPSVSAVSSATTDSNSHSSQSPVLPSGSLPSTLPAGNISDGLIPSSVPAPVIPDVVADQCSSIRSEESFIQPADFPPDSSLSGPQTFMSVFPTSLPLLQPTSAQHQSPLPAVPLSSSLSPAPAAFAAPETPKFGLCESTVITHTASATLTHNAPATTFSQSQSVVLATQQPGAGVPCNLAFQTAVVQGQPRPQVQSQLTFALPKPVPLASAGTRPKQSQKIVPAPKLETVSLLVKNAFITPGRDCQNSGQASPCTSEQSPSPQSPQNSCSGKSATDPTMAAFKNRRMRHLSEQKRRFNIKIGFSALNSLVSANSKSISHAITLQKTVEYIAKLQQERTQMQEETRRLREEIEELNATILSCQQQLPATGVPVTRQRFDHMKRLFDEYVRSRTLQNWKFWIFSIIIKPLFESFNGMVSTTSFKDLNETALAWLDQHCTLPILRPMVLNTLRHLSRTTSILTDPSQLPEQAREAVMKVNKRAGET
ncbi:PREDICTED: MLX-interacting protein isoform X2 [Corvus brachyrhynchos]|uniref:MLX-interacting protein isoform X2 n=1 Tax=Corvus brachyrhynchos TaxID=85066 RepID=UPI000816695A|nr:PREDICTED: MLX-interacting protein isoform X2 [Corvus brachyrhynchos]